METLFEYYGFSSPIKDRSGFYQGQPSYASIKDDLYVVFDLLVSGELDLYFVQYNSREDIGKLKPVAANKLIKGFKIDLKEHRETLQQYLDYN